MGGLNRYPESAIQRFDTKSLPPVQSMDFSAGRDSAIRFRIATPARAHEFRMQMLCPGPRSVAPGARCPVLGARCPQASRGLRKPAEDSGSFRKPEEAFGSSGSLRKLQEALGSFRKTWEASGRHVKP